MAEAPLVSPRDYDAWQQASAYQLLQLLLRLGVDGKIIAHWIGVKPAAISQWNRQRRPIPTKHRPPLLEWAQRAIEQATALNDKDVSLQPTEALQLATRAEFTAIWAQWKSEVLYTAGTLHKALAQQYQNLGKWLLKPRMEASDREDIVLILDHLLYLWDFLLRMQPEDEPPSAEEELYARLTQAREDAGPIVRTPEERAAAEVDMPDVLPPEP